MTIQSFSSCIPNEEIPVLLTIFNRPGMAKAVIDNLRQLKPKTLFISADGPRTDVLEDIEKCRLARKEVASIDWECDVKTRFLDDNVGCDPAVSSAIEWFFQSVEYGVILEDDCLVDMQFFLFCGELLVKYADDERVMQISSLSPYATREYPCDYHFSRMFRCSGGWSTWRRAWKLYTSDMHQYSDRDALRILKACQRDYYISLWQYRKLQQFKGLEINEKHYWDHYWAHWDFQWNLACSAQNGLSIVPERNLMINIGFDEDSTHTQKMTPVFDNVKVQKLQFPLRHPQFVYADSQPERDLDKKIYRSLSLKSRCMYLLRRALGAIYYLRERMPYG